MSSAGATSSGRSSLIDWSLAVATAERLVRPGPEISRDGAAAAVAQLRTSAQRAEAYVAKVTGLSTASATAPVLVIDRPGWIAANVDVFGVLLAPLLEKAAERLSGNQAMASLGGRITGVEIGALLSYLAPRVLGQFDPFFPGVDGGPAGRLLLVAPNVVAVERELRLDPTDFRLWVCLHEEVHRVQFTAVPWLRDHLNGLIAQVVSTTELDAAALAQMLREAVKKVGEAVRGEAEVSIVDLVQTPAQRATIDQITAVMSLLEGHADVVTDSVGPDVIPTVAEIRARFTQRRAGQGFDKVIRKLLGLDAKLRQYRDGARFCRAVIDEVGMSGLNRVWTSPETLPTRAEIADPALWVARLGAEPALA